MVCFQVLITTGVLRQEKPKSNAPNSHHTSQNLNQCFLTNIAFLIFSPVYSTGLRQETWQLEWAADWSGQVKG